MWQSFLSVLIFILAFFQPLSSQTQMKELINELPMPNQESEISSLPIKSNLPCKFFRNIGSSFVGISDAGLDSTTAFNQAFSRAISLIALQNGQARGMSDFYNDTNGEQTNSNYEELCEIKASNNLPVAGLKIYDSYRLISGEFVLFLNVDSTNLNIAEKVLNKTSVSIYYKENEQDGSRKIINKILLENKITYADTTKDHSEKLTYMLANNRWLCNETFFDNRKIDIGRYKIFYSVSDECLGDTIGYKSNGTSSVDGLWYALSTNMYRQLSVQLKEHFQKVKNVGDQYKDKIVTLNRESGFTRFSCRITNIGLVDNKLITSIKTEF